MILVYATTDGTRYFRKERALTSFEQGGAETTAAVQAPRRNLGTVEDPETEEQYATEAQRMAAEHDPEDVI